MGIELLEDPKTIVAHYPQFKVIMYNDSKTTVDFVVEVLTSIFKMDRIQAVKATLAIHNNGQEIVGIYPLEQAEFKVEQTHSLARGRNFPLTCTIEEA